MEFRTHEPARRHFLAGAEAGVPRRPAAAVDTAGHSLAGRTAAGSGRIPAGFAGWHPPTARCLDLPATARWRPSALLRGAALLFMVCVCQYICMLSFQTDYPATFVP